MTDVDVKNQWISTLGYFWREVFLDSDWVLAYSASMAVPFDQLYDEIARLAPYTARSKIPVVETQSVRLFIIDESLEDRNAYHYGDSDLLYGDPAVYGAQITAMSSRRFQFDTRYRPPFLTAGIVKPEAILELGVDYTFEPGWIIFKTDPVSVPGLQKRVRQANGIMYYEFLFWGFQVARDINAVSDFFGTVAGITGDTSKWLYDAMNAAWDIRVEGASFKNITRIVGLTADTDYVTAAGTVQAISREGGRICVITDTGAYSAPLTAEVLVNVGTAVKAGDIIFDSFAVHLAADYVPFIDFEGLSLGSEYVAMLPTPHELMFVNTEVPLTGGPGNYEFFIGGSPPWVAAFLQYLNTQPRTPSFFDMLAARYGRVPTSVNPYEEIKFNFFRNSAFFIKVRLGSRDSREIAQMFSILKRTVPAGAGFFVILEKTLEDERVQPGAAEIVEVFYAAGDPDEGPVSVSETVLSTPVV